MKFKATEQVDALDYDFAPYHDAKGVVPEPTDDQVSEFYAGLGGVMRDSLGDDDPRTKDLDVTDSVSVGKLFASLTAEDHRSMSRQMMDVHLAVTSEKPPRDCLEELPYRLRQAWYGAVQEWLRPEASRAATKK